MKKIKYLSWAIVAFVAINFTACEVEPTDAFPQEVEIENPANEGQFIATIAGEEFQAETAAGVMTPENELFISGLKSSTGQKIDLSISNAAIGNFALTTGSSSSNFGRYIDGVINAFPYMSADSLGGSGIMQITEINTDSLTITGTFNFIGGRPQVDVEGNPILDGNGDPVIENIQITEGAFNSIPYTIEDDGGGGGTGTDPENEFFAIVDGVDFIADSIQVTEPIIGGIQMIKVEARNSQGALIRIDVPRNLGVGTFAMENLSDGTKLIALYNDGLGGENLTSNPGTITITEFDLELGSLKATFAFTGTDPLGIDQTVVEVTEGSFTAIFVGVPGATNAFLATVDGAAYVPETITITQSMLNGIPNLTIITTRGEQSMGLTFPLIIDEAAYPMGPVFENGDEKVGSYNPLVGTSITYVSNPGVLTITNYDITGGIIEGTFVFTAVDPTGMDETEFGITSGSFLAVIE